MQPPEASRPAAGKNHTSLLEFVLLDLSNGRSVDSLVPGKPEKGPALVNIPLDLEVGTQPTALDGLVNQSLNETGPDLGHVDLFDKD